MLKKSLAFIFAVGVSGGLSIGVLANAADGKAAPGSSTENPEKIQMEKDLAVEPASANVEFVAIGRPALLKIKGQTRSLLGSLKYDPKDRKTVSGEFSVPLKTLTTGIDLRDEHMKNKYLQVEQFPQAILKIEKLRLSDEIAPDKSPLSLPFEGQLTLHGVTKPIGGNAVISTKSTGQYSANARFTIKLTDFGIDVPSYAGIKVADQVDLGVQLEVKDQ